MRRGRRNRAVWHRWFAWKPVLLDGGGPWVWLEAVERRVRVENNYGGTVVHRHYRDLQHKDD